MNAAEIVMSAAIDRSGCPGTRHGTADAYRHNRCRCLDATAANTRYGKLRRAGLIEPVWVDNVGVVRRRRALAAIGYGLEELAPYFGVKGRAIGDQAGKRRSRVRRETLERWRQVYALLSMTPGPNELARQRARRLGWAPPLAWDDIDDPAAVPDFGERSARSRLDAAEEARHLLGFGLSLASVADRLGVSVPWLKQLLGQGRRAA